MPERLKLRATEEFLSNMADLESERVVGHVGRIVAQLQAFPGMGRPRPRQMLRDRYGQDIRTMAVDGYLLVYRTDSEVLELVSLVPGRTIK